MFCESNELVGFRGKDCEGFLDDDVFAGKEEGLGDGVVRGVGGSYDCEADFGVGEDGGEVVVDFGGGVVPRGGIVGGGRALEDAVEVETWSFEDVGDLEDLCREAVADDAGIDWHCSGGCGVE